MPIVAQSSMLCAPSESFETLSAKINTSRRVFNTLMSLNPEGTKNPSSKGQSGPLSKEYDLLLFPSIQTLLLLIFVLLSPFSTTLPNPESKTGDLFMWLAAGVIANSTISTPSDCCHALSPDDPIRSLLQVPKARDRGQVLTADAWPPPMPGLRVLHLQVLKACAWLPPVPSLSVPDLKAWDQSVLQTRDAGILCRNKSNCKSLFCWKLKMLMLNMLSTKITFPTQYHNHLGLFPNNSHKATVSQMRENTTPKLPLPFLPPLPIPSSHFLKTFETLGWRTSFARLDMLREAKRDRSQFATTGVLFGCLGCTPGAPCGTHPF